MLSVSPPLRSPDTAGLPYVVEQRIGNMQTVTAQSRDQSANPEADQPNRLYQCSTCKRSFTRADHLTRHVRARMSPYPLRVSTFFVS